MRPKHPCSGLPLTENPTRVGNLSFGILLTLACLGWFFTSGRDYSGAGAQADAGSPIFNGLWAIVYAVTLFGVWKRRVQVREYLSVSRPLLYLTVIVLASSLWSDVPMLTARRAVQNVGTDLLVLYFICRLGSRAFVETVADTLVLAGAVSLALIVFVPELGSLYGSWAGIFSSKNFMGPAVVMGSISIACLIGETRGPRRVSYFCGFGIFIILLVGSGNSSGQLTAVALLALGPALVWSRKRRSIKVLVWTFIGLASIILVATSLGFGPSEVLALLNKDTSLSGRTDLWQDVFNAIAEKPTFGYGYGVFWGSDGPAANSVYADLGWTPDSSHNGFIEVALSFGAVGEIFLLLVIGIGLMRAAKMFWRSNDLFSLWPLLTMISIVLTNFAGATFVAYATLDWMIYLGAFFVATDDWRRQSALPDARRNLPRTDRFRLSPQQALTKP